jgi:AcrR family transcriptional regulator
MRFTKKQISDVALKLFTQKGYEATTVSDIIKTTGISKGGLYHHFTSKEEIANDICEGYVKAIKSHFEKNKSKCKSPLEKLTLLSQAQYKVLKRKQRAIRSLYYNPINTKLREKIQKLYVEIFMPILIGILEEGKKTGDFTVRHPKVTAHFLFELQNSLCSVSTETMKDPRKLKIYEDELTHIYGILLGINKKHFSKPSS